MPIITVGKRSFTSKSELKAYEKATMAQLPITNSLKTTTTPEIFQFYRDLVDRHPDASRKLAGGVIDFKIAPSVRNVRAKELQVVHNDGTCSSISRDTCIKQISDSNYTRLRASQRTAINTQISEFRSGRTCCEHCKQSALGVLGEVDHIKSFDELAREFCTNRIDIPTNFGKNAGTNQHCFLEADSIFSEEWQAYHKKNAELRLLCISCHKSYTHTGNLPDTMLTMIQIPLVERC